jgi:hypothetical protein
MSKDNILLYNFSSEIADIVGCERNEDTLNSSSYINLEQQQMEVDEEINSIFFKNITSWKKKIIFDVELKNYNKSNNSTNCDNILSNFSLDSSSTDDSVNEKNQHFVNYLNSQEESFVYLIRHTYFECGYDNDFIISVKKFFNKNLFGTFYWLHSFYGRHQLDKDIVEAILITLSTFRVKDLNSFEGFISIIRSCLTDKDDSLKEAALMVIERWRTKECLSALESAESYYKTDGLRDYANAIKLELEEELK